MIDFAGRAAFVQGVEVDAIYLLVEQAGALFGGVVDANAFHGCRIGVRPVKRPDELGREAGAASQFGHPVHARQ